MPNFTVAKDTKVMQKAKKPLSDGYIALFIILGIAFVIPWVLLTLYFIRKRQRLHQLQF